MAKRCTTFFVYPLTIATPNLQPRILHDPDPIGIILGYRLTGGGARHAVTGTVVALITSLPTYCRFHGLAMTKFVRSHLIQSAVSEDRAETIRKVCVVSHVFI